MSNSRDKRTFKFADEDYAVIRPKIEQVKEANEITDVENVIASILLVDNLRIQKN